MYSTSVLLLIVYTLHSSLVCVRTWDRIKAICVLEAVEKKKKKKKKRKAGNLGDDGQVPRRDGSTRITVMRGQIQLFERFLTNQV